MVLLDRGPSRRIDRHPRAVRKLSGRLRLRACCGLRSPARDCPGFASTAAAKKSPRRSGARSACREDTASSRQGRGQLAVSRGETERSLCPQLEGTLGKCAASPRYGWARDRPEPGWCAARSLPDSHPRGTDHDETIPGVRRCRAPCQLGRGVGASAHAGFPRRGKSHGCAARRQQPEDWNARPAAGGNLAGCPRSGPGDDRRSSILTEENGA